ncbi:MAG: AI-2E family transporter [Patescibacteria group bacterium]
MKQTTDHTVMISRSTIVFTVALLLGLYFIFQIRDVLSLAFVAFIFTVAINPATKKVQKWLKLSRLTSIITTYFIIVSAIFTIFALLLPPLVTELGGLLRYVDMPGLQEEIQGFRFSITELGNLADRIGSSVTALVTFLLSTFEGLFTVFTLIMMSLFMLIERGLLKKRLQFFFADENHVKKALSLMDETEVQLGGWIRGQVIMMIIIGCINYLGLSLLGVPYALPLAILAGILEILPNLGPVLAAVPAILIAFVALSPWMALIVLIFYVIVQQLESNVLYPKVISETADVSPLVSILSILIGYTLGGIAGAFLAVPTFILLRVIFQTYLQEKIVHPS